MKTRNRYSGIIIVGAVSSLLLHCAPLRPAVKVNTFGDFQTNQNKKLSEEARFAKLDEARLKQVKIVTGQLPEGIDLSENGSKIVVARGYEQRYKVLGTVESNYRDAKGMNYEETWRKALCYPQIPLVYATLLTWLIVPTSWPCVTKAPSSPEERKEELAQYLRRGAHAMGGNLVILLNDGSMEIMTVSANKYGATGSVSKLEGSMYKGFVLKETVDESHVGVMGGLRGTLIKKDDATDVDGDIDENCDEDCAIKQNEADAAASIGH